MIHILKDTLRESVEKSTNGKVTVLYDDKGYPSYMNVIPKFKVEDIDPSLGSGVHPAFIVGGVEKSEIFIGQYQAHVKDSRAVSMPGLDPTTYTTFDQAKEYCKNKGQGWHLMTNWEWAAMALMSLKQNKEIIEDISKKWEWNDGLKLVDGKIFMPSDNNYTLDEAQWNDTGVFIDATEDESPLFSNTLKNSNVWSFKSKWNEVETKPGFQVPNELKQAVVAPHFNMSAKGAMWADNDGEMLPLRGGSWFGGSDDGLFAFSLFYERSLSNSSGGFRPAYIG